MSSLETQEFLRQHGLEKLQRNLHVQIKRHKAHPNLVGLKYDQKRSPFNNAVVRECRGLILDEQQGWEVTDMSS